MCHPSIEWLIQRHHGSLKGQSIGNRVGAILVACRPGLGKVILFIEQELSYTHFFLLVLMLVFDWLLHRILLYLFLIRFYVNFDCIVLISYSFLCWFLIGYCIWSYFTYFLLVFMLDLIWLYLYLIIFYVSFDFIVLISYSFLCCFLIGYCIWSYCTYFLLPY